MEKKNKLTKLELSWVLYDVGNSAFTMLACSLITIWFKDIAGAAGLDPGHQTSYWAYATALATVLVAVIGPVCGAIADYKGYKKTIFLTSLVIGVLACLAMGFITSWLAFLIVFVLSKAAYNSSLVFYDAMITDVTTPDRMDRVSSYGYAWGYIGSCIPFIICLLAYVAGEGMLGASAAAVISQKTARIIGFVTTAAWWFIVSLPLIKNYEQKYYIEHQSHVISNTFKRIGITLKKIATRDKKILFFLIAFFLYIDGVNTIIDNAVNIGTDLGLDTVGLVVLLLGTQVVAFAFSLIFTALLKKFKMGQLIKVCIFGYAVVALYALTLNNLLQFGILAFGIGMFQGSIQALSRAYYGNIIPSNESGEYFGLYDIFSKGAAFLGAVVIGVVKDLTGSIQIAVATLAVFFILGFIFFSMADKLETNQVDCTVSKED